MSHLPIKMINPTPKPGQTSELYPEGYIMTIHSYENYLDAQCSKQLWVKDLESVRILIKFFKLFNNRNVGGIGNIYDNGDCEEEGHVWDELLGFCKQNPRLSTYILGLGEDSDVESIKLMIETLLINTRLMLTGHYFTRACRKIEVFKTEQVNVTWIR